MKLGESSPRLLGKVVRHLQINVIWGKRLFSCPTVIDDLDQFIRDVEAPLIAPAILEPLLQLVAGVLIEDIDIQFSLLRKTGEGQVAATKKTSRRVVGISSMNQIELCVERVAQEQLYNELLGFKLCAQPPKPRFVRIVRRSEHQL